MEIKQLTQMKAYMCPFAGKDIGGNINLEKSEDSQCL